jgi:Family of unknown function (DUF5706)
MSDRVTPDESAREPSDLLGAGRLAFSTPVREYPPLADKKATTLLAVIGVMVTVVTLFSQSLDAHVEGAGAIVWLTRAVLLAWFVLALLCAWHAYVCLTLSMPHRSGQEPHSLAFYQNIAELPPAAYEREVREMSHSRALRDMLVYEYTVASLSAAKFRSIERSVRFLCLAFGVWIILMLLLVFSPTSDPGPSAMTQPAQTSGASASPKR